MFTETFVSKIKDLFWNLLIVAIYIIISPVAVIIYIRLALHKIHMQSLLEYDVWIKLGIMIVNFGIMPTLIQIISQNSLVYKRKSERD